jgi:hypothetical protein
MNTALLVVLIALAIVVAGIYALAVMAAHFMAAIEVESLEDLQ